MLPDSPPPVASLSGQGSGASAVGWRATPAAGIGTAEQHSRDEDGCPLLGVPECPTGFQWEPGLQIGLASPCVQPGDAADSPSPP